PYDPAGNSGDGKLLANDVVQVRRYAATLDPAQPAGGPIAPVPAADPLDEAANADNASDSAKSWAIRTVRVVSRVAETGSKVAVSVEMDSQGDEVAMSFGLNFDPATLSNPVIT